jgi:hypothetical protein
MTEGTLDSPAYAGALSAVEERSIFTREVSERWRQLAFWAAVLSVTFLAAFVFPFLFPLKQAVFSPAYTVGSNNRVGALAVALVSVLTAAACLRLPAACRGLRTRFADTVWGRSQLVLSLIVVVAFSSLLGVLIVRSGTYYADAGYFITQLRTGLVFHRALYREVEFAYGPLLYLWPAFTVRALGHFGWSMQASYMASFVLMEAVGTAMLYWTVSALPMSARMKTIAFALLVLLTLDPQAGLNYTAFRFILPTFSLVFLSRQHRLSVAGVTAFWAAVLNFAVSPELGVAFTAGAGCYGLYRAVTSQKRFIVVSACAIAGASMFSIAMGRGYFSTMAEFAKGGYNEILEPAPHIYVLLVCAVTLAPLAVATAMRDGGRKRYSGTVDTAAMLVGIFIAGLAMLAPALGRCDPLHVSFNGWALFLLSCVAVDQMGRVGKQAWLVIAVLFCGYTTAQEFALEKGPLERVLLHRPDPLENVDPTGLALATNGQRVAFPLSQALAALDHLTAMNLYEPQYLCIPAASAEAERRVVQDMRRANYAMVPNTIDLLNENKINNVGMRYHMRFNYKYRARRAPFIQGAATLAELQQHWQPAGIYGSYTLYRKVD